MPDLSVIIPTHKRADILKQCLEHIEGQTICYRLEVIVVSDGHDEKTAALFAEKNWKIPVTFFEIAKAQQGIARNRGVEKATSPLCLFIGDDFILAPDACEKHLQCHKKNSSEQKMAVLGFTTWDPAVGITPVMQWLEKTGWQFGYPMIAKYAHDFLQKGIQHRFTYTSMISLPTETALANPFREDVSLYGWEDIEWGTRLRDAGIALFFEPDAKALHHHKIDLEGSLKRMETLGTSVVHFSSVIPEFDRLPKGAKLIAYKVFALLPTLAGKHRKAFLRGIKHACSS